MEMTTPSKSAIESKARELYAQDQLKAGCSELASINPEREELRESGYIMLAQNLLMRDSDVYKQHIISELGENPEQFKAKAQSFDFDVVEGLRSGTAIIGGRGTGKSNLCKLIVKEYIAKGCTVKVFDVSKAWLENTPIPNYVEAVPNAVLDIPLYRSTIFDLSRLHVKTIKSFVAQVVAREFELQVNIPERKPIIYCFEDSVISIPKNRLSSLEAEELLRLIAVGRNFDLGYVAIMQRTALTDTTLLELSAQKYIGRLDGKNDKRNLKPYIDEAVQQLDGLQIGDFIYDFGDTTKKISVPLFTSESKPKRIEPTSLEQQPQDANLILGYLVIALIFLGTLLFINAVFR